MGLVPMVIEQTTGRTRLRYLQRLLRDNIVFLGTPIDDNIANVIIAQLLFLTSEDPEKDIQLYINSPVVRLRQASQSTTPCSTSRTMCRRSASGRRRRWERSC